MAGQHVIVGDFEIPRVRAGLGGREGRGGAAVENESGPGRRSYRPLQIESVEHADVGPIAHHRHEGALRHRLADPGIDNRCDILDRQRRRGDSFSQIVVHHRDRDIVEHVRRRGRGVVVEELTIEGVGGGAGGQRKGLGDAIAPIDGDVEGVFGPRVDDVELEVGPATLLDVGLLRRDRDRRHDVVDMQGGCRLPRGNARVVVDELDREDDIVAVGARRVVVVELDRNLEAAASGREGDGSDGAAARPCDLDRVRVENALVGKGTAQHRAAALVDGGHVEGEGCDHRVAIDQQERLA